MELMKQFSPDFFEYLKDESRTLGNAESISFPRTEAEVVEILKYAYSNSIGVTVQGSRTGLAAAAVPMGGNVMNMSKMNAIKGCKIRDGSFFFVLEPGLTLMELNKKISSKKFHITDKCEKSIDAFNKFLDSPPQFFTPDPTETTCALGGMVACNASGARSFMYGATRQYIDKLRIVLADGRLLNLKRGRIFAQGRKLSLTTENGDILNLYLPNYTMPKTKNASGYFVEDNMDAIDLFIGSDGTLGVITEITVRLTPLPKEIWGVSCFFENPTQAVDFVNLVRHKTTGIAALEYFDGNALDLLRAQKNIGTAFSQLPEIPKDYICCVYAEIHAEDIAEAEKVLFEIGEKITAANGNCENTWVARNSTDIEKLHFFRHAVPECANMIIDKRKKIEPIITKLGTDMSVPDEFLSDVMALYKTSIEELGLESATWGHIGNNHLHVNILPRNAEDYKKGKELYSAWAEKITKMGGAVSAEHGIGKTKAEFLRVMYGKNAIEEMSDLKYSLDPKGILGEGNLFPSKKGGSI